MIANRIIDNAGVAIAAINRRPVVSARTMGLAHPRNTGAAIFGVDSEKAFSSEWAAWANGTAVRELDMHDTFLAADYGTPATIFLHCSPWRKPREIRPGLNSWHRHGLRNSN